MFQNLISKLRNGATAVPAHSRQEPAGKNGPQMPPPIQLPHTEPPAIEYPLDQLTPGLRAAVVAIVAMTQAPVAIAAQSVLAVASLTVAGRAKVETLGSPAMATAYFLAIALSGERKSAADKIAMSGVDRVVMQVRAEHQVALQDYEASVAGLGRGETKPPKPVCPGFLVTEPTVEGSFKAIGTGVGFLAWFTDEAAAFWGGHSMSGEQRAKSAGIISKLWDGSYFYRPRATQDGDGYVPPTATTLNLMFQPVLIKDTYGDDFLMGQGILARMLPAWPESKIGTRKYRQSTEEERAAAEIFQNETAERLLASLNDPTLRMLALSHEARATCVEFHDKIEAEMARGRWAAEISSFAAKCPEHACRLAAIMTLFEDADATLISGDVMAQACEIVKYHLAQFKYLCIAATNETIVGRAQILLDWLRVNVKPGNAFATDQVLQFGPVGTRRAQALDKALAVLQSNHWVAALPAGTVVDGKKRRKAFLLNPGA